MFSRDGKARVLVGTYENQDEEQFELRNGVHK